MLDDYELLQKRAYKIIKNSIANNKFSHAYIIESNGYSNSLLFALAISKTILCPYRYTNKINCKNCLQCEKVDKENNLDIKIIKPEGLQIKKQQLDELQKEFSKTSILGNKKIYIISEAEKLNDSSSNSILKFLEEPPSNVIAILITNSLDSLLSTIVSRCQVLSLNGDNDPIKKIKEAAYDINFEEKFERAMDFVKAFESDKEEAYVKIKSNYFNYFPNRREMLISFDIIVLFYIEILNEKLEIESKTFEKYEELKIEVKKINSTTSLEQKIKIISGIKKLLEKNINLSLAIDKFYIEMRNIK